MAISLYVQLSWHLFLIMHSLIVPPTYSHIDNYPQPHKRPLSSITPTIIEHPSGSLALTIGASGGSRIFPAVFQTLVNLDWGLDASEAVEYGRIHDQLYPQLTEVDNVFPHEIIEDLKGKGHNMTGMYELACWLVNSTVSG